MVDCLYSIFDEDLIIFIFLVNFDDMFFYDKLREFLLGEYDDKCFMVFLCGWYSLDFFVNFSVFLFFGGNK